MTAHIYKADNGRPLEDVVRERFDVVEDERDGWLAWCPVHEATKTGNPSLRVAAGRNGQLLLKCRSRGCDAADIAEAAGVSLSATYDTSTVNLAASTGTPKTIDDRRTEAEKLTAWRTALAMHAANGTGGVTDFLDRFGLTLHGAEALGLGWNGNRVIVPAHTASGDLAYWQGRAVDPEAEVRWMSPRNGDDGTVWDAAGWIGGRHPGRRVIVTEGPSDGLTVAALDEYEVIAIRGGASGARIAEVAEHLRGRKVYVAGDGDKTGQGFNEQVAAALSGIAKVYRITLDKGMDLGDAREEHPASFALRLTMMLQTTEELEVLLDDTGADTVAPKRDSGKKLPVGAELAQTAKDRYTFHHTPRKELFAVPRHGPRIPVALKGNKAGLRAELAAAYLRATGRPANNNSLAETMQAMEGEAYLGSEEELHLRVAAAEGAYWIDLGDKTGDAIRLDGTGWRVVPGAPVLFRRTELTAALPRPDRKGSLEDLWSVLNVAEADRPILVAVLVAALMPNIAHVIVNVNGEQGTGKSTATRILGSIIDPQTVPLRKAPRNADEWVVSANSSWVVPLDNLSKLPEWLSDALCRASTGDGDVRRALYTDMDVSVISFRRVVLMNGIDILGIKDDLADRLVHVELSRIADTERREDGDLAAKWREAWPKVLGAILDLAVQVIATMPNVRPERLPRMADFARVLATVDEVMGTEGTKRYAEQQTEAARDAIDEDPITAYMTKALGLRKEWTGAPADLLDLMRNAVDHDREQIPRDWPRSGRELSTMLSRKAPSLRRLGWTVEKTGTRTKRGQEWRIVKPSD